MEHAEHAVHASHDAFNRQVTMSIAIVAAVLACVTMLGHRAHNETLLLQGESLRFQGEALQLQTLASIESTEAAKKWQYYATKNLFHLESSITLDLLKVIALNEGSKDELGKTKTKHQGIVDKYTKKLPEIEAEGRAIEKKIEEYKVQTKEKLNEYQETMKKSHEVHEKGSRFDYGELGLQFGVVLCSLAILTRSRGFWFAGIVSSAVGAAIAMTGQFGLFIGHH